MKDLQVVVVGAGIGGLQTSLALAKDGHRVTVLESAKAFEEVCLLHHDHIVITYFKAKDVYLELQTLTFAKE